MHSVLNLAQHIEDGFEHNTITGVAFIDLSAGYDTVNHRKLINKVYHTTRDFQSTTIIRRFRQNRFFSNAEWEEQQVERPEKWTTPGQRADTCTVQFVQQ